jgi:hypothetical protein
VSVAERRVLAREATISTLVAAGLAAALAWLGPPGVDLAAHAYQRTFLLEHGFAVWNNFWYAGRYSFVTYSFLYYPLAALLGIRLLAVATVAAAALAFTLLVWREWGPAARLSSRSFAVLWTGIVLSAAFPFALAMAFALLALAALQREHRGRFALAAALCLAASPLAFALLAVLMGGLAVARRSLRDVRVPVAVVLAGGLAEVALYRLFADTGRFPFSVWELIPALIFCGLGLIATWDVPAARPLHGLFWIYLLACLVAFAIPSSVGSNIERIRYAALPIALLAVGIRRWRPLYLVVPSVVLAAIWNVTPIATSYARASADPAGTPTYWQPAIAYLHAHLTPSYRVEAVDTVDHWPAEYLPDARIPIVRGWYRQGDFPQNELLYDGRLRAAPYRAWLHRLGVRYVVLSDAPPDYSSRAEATLLRSGDSGLMPVFRARHVVVYEVPHASGVVSGAAGARVLSLGPARIVAALSAPGRYRVKVRWTPYWRPSAGCVARAPDGTVTLAAPRAGLVTLEVAVNVQRGLQALAGVTPTRVCAG